MKTVIDRSIPTPRQLDADVKSFNEREIPGLLATIGAKLSQNYCGGEVAMRLIAPASNPVMERVIREQLEKAEWYVHQFVFHPLQTVNGEGIYILIVSPYPTKMNDSDKGACFQPGGIVYYMGDDAVNSAEAVVAELKKQLSQAHENASIFSDSATGVA